MNWLVLLDIVLVVLLALRMTRFFTSDSLGLWWFYEPLHRKAYGRGSNVPTPKWARYVEGLTCPFCVGFWCCALALLSLYIAGGPGHAWDLWRWVAAAFALNYVTGHVSARAD